MAPPAVPFALIGAVQLGSAVTWVGVAVAACFPRLRRAGTPPLVLGALAIAAAEIATVLRFGMPSSDPLAWLRVGGLLLVAGGLAAAALQPRAGMALPAVVVPLGAHLPAAVAGGLAGVVATAVVVRAAARDRLSFGDRGTAGSLGVGMAFTAVATALQEPARSQTSWALAELAARGAAAVALVVMLALLARANLLGKVVGAIAASVVAMAIAAISVVGSGVVAQVQRDQSGRLLSVAQAQQQSLDTLATRAGLFARVVAQCPQSRSRCVSFLKLFSVDPDYFAVLAVPGVGAKTVAPSPHALSGTSLLQLFGSAVVRAALSPSATAQTVASGPLLVGSPQRLAVVAAVPGRPGGSQDSRVRPSYAAVYGIGLTDAYLRSVKAATGYDVSVVADGAVLASSLPSDQRGQIRAVAATARVDAGSPTASSVTAATGNSPTVAFVPVTQAGNDNVRAATLAVSQPASVALAAQHSLLRRLVVTTLIVLAGIALLALGLARRIADPIRRLTIAAGRIRRGDLAARVSVGARDEVGVLARAFDDMTTSLRGLTGELRAAADQEAALRARLETVIGSMTDGLLATDAEDVVTAVNPTALSLLALESATAVVGRRLGDVLDIRMGDGEPSPGFDDRVPYDGMLRRADGTDVPVRVAVAPLADTAGRVVLVADRTRDREIERLKTEFLSNVSHELRTPLTPIRGYAEMLARRPDLSPGQVQGFVGEILSSTSRMQRAVELLVDVAALEAGRVVLRPRAVTAASIVDDRVDVWRARYPERAADLKRRVARGLPQVEVDPVWLRKALDELADNAVKHSPAGSAITLAASRPAGEDAVVRLSVRDAGTGFDESRRAELLRDFSQADASETRATGGLGLGLGFVSRLADRLGLALHAQSRLGHGSEFALDLPVATRDEAADDTRLRAGSRVRRRVRG